MNRAIKPYLSFYLDFRCTGMSGGRYGTFEESFAEEAGNLCDIIHYLIKKILLNLEYSEICISDLCK